jgi:ABC-type lipoprotein export system ATPase subunit
VRVRHISVTGLFGVYNHEIPLQEEGRITIIHGMNGIGKTIVLRMIAEALTGKYDVLLNVPYERVELRLEDGSLLRVSNAGPGTGARLVHHPVVVHILADGTKEAVNYYMHGNDFAPEAPWLDVLRSAMSVQLVETGRLQTRPFVIEPGPRDDAAERLAVSVQEYSQDIHLRIEQRQFAYYKTWSQLAQSFPARILSKNGVAPFSPDELRKRLMDLGRRHDMLSSFGIEPPAEVILDVSEDTDKPTLKTLSIYVRDMATALAVFDELIARITMLTELVNSRFRNKRLAVRLERGFVISDRNGAEIPVTALSSGEQHELVMVYDLLFRTRPDTLVLIDEPEISLDILWQQEFIDDLSKIVELTSVDILIATHSPDVAGRHWGWTVALTGPAE